MTDTSGSSARDSRLTPETVAGRNCSLVKRGYSEHEVRSFLRLVADELSSAAARERELNVRVRDVEEQSRRPVLPPSDDDLIKALGEETARVLGISPATVKRDWRMARAWLHRELSPGAAHDFHPVGEHVVVQRGQHHARDGREEKAHCEAPAGQQRDTVLTRRWMDAIGIDVAVMFPTPMLQLGLHPQVGRKAPHREVLLQRVDVDVDEGRAGIGRDEFR